MAFFSIIIPAFNCEETLSRAINSVLSQDYHDYEVIIVNDGSVDQTKRVAMEYIERSPKIKLFNIENSGPSAARNLGLDNASGQYVLFIDSDDMLQQGTLQYLHEQLDDGHNDVLIFGFTITDANMHPIMDYGAGDAVFSNRAELGNELPGLYQANLLNQVWNKAYSLNWLKNTAVRFEDYRYAEDRLFVLEILRHVRRVKVAQKPCYLYVNSGNASLISRYNDKKFECSLLVNRRIRSLAQECGNESAFAAEVWDYMFFKTIVSCMTQLYHPTCPLNAKQRRNAIRQILDHPDVHRKFYLNRDAGLHTRVLYGIIRTRMIWLISLALRSIVKIGSGDTKRFIRLKHRSIDNKE